MEQRLTGKIRNQPFAISCKITIFRCDVALGQTYRREKMPRGHVYPG